MTLFCFRAKHARAYSRTAPRNRSANFRASPPALAAAIPVRVFSGHSAVAAAIAAAVAVVRIVAETAEERGGRGGDRGSVDASNAVPVAVVGTAASADVLDTGTPVTDIRAVLN